MKLSLYEKFDEYVLQYSEDIKGIQINYPRENYLLANMKFNQLSLDIKNGIEIINLKQIKPLSNDYELLKEFIFDNGQYKTNYYETNSDMFNDEAAYIVDYILEQIDPIIEKMINK